MKMGKLWIPKLGLFGIQLLPMFKQKHVFVPNFRSDLAYFDGLSETILCAGLVKPKPGVFQFCWPVEVYEKYSRCI